MINVAGQIEEEKRKERQRIDDLCHDARLLGRIGMSLDYVKNRYSKNESLDAVIKIAAAYRDGVDARDRAERSRNRPSLFRKIYNRIRRSLWAKGEL